MKNVFLTALAAMALIGCATRPPPPATQNTFVLEEDLLGATVARGEFRSITGARRGFSASLNGAWDGRTMTLVEDFVFDDGERERKTWVLERIAPGRYVGSREDVVGRAIGFQDGPVFRLEYDVILPSENGRGLKMRFRDVLADTGAGLIVNRASVGFLGVRVATVSLDIRREVPVN